jgi:hypothetical protein
VKIPLVILCSLAIRITWHKTWIILRSLPVIKMCPVSVSCDHHFWVLECALHRVHSQLSSQTWECLFVYSSILLTLPLVLLCSATEAHPWYMAPGSLPRTWKALIWAVSPRESHSLLTEHQDPQNLNIRSQLHPIYSYFHRQTAMLCVVPMKLIYFNRK